MPELCVTCKKARSFVTHECERPGLCSCRHWGYHVESGHKKEEKKTQMATKTVMILETKSGPEIEISRKSNQDFVGLNDSEIPLEDVKTLIKLLARAADLPRSWGGKEED